MKPYNSLLYTPNLSRVAANLKQVTVKKSHRAKKKSNCAVKKFSCAAKKSTLTPKKRCLACNLVILTRKQWQQESNLTQVAAKKSHRAVKKSTCTSKKSPLQMPQSPSAINNLSLPSKPQTTSFGLMLQTLRQTVSISFFKILHTKFPFSKINLHSVIEIQLQCQFTHQK